MSQTSIRSQRNMKWEGKPLLTYDCSICLTINTSQLLELPCHHNICLSCLHMICAHSSLACPFCRCRLSTWLRYNPDYSKLIIQREPESKIIKKTRGRPRSKFPKNSIEKKQPKRHYESSKPKPTIDQQGAISNDWLLAQKIHYEQLEEFRYTHGRVTRSMAKKMDIS
ncbi:unnamed protein product [Adineta steineri]|uniref:RING-type domain-containing protein n=1 Tax=Adineta steineri TaxID=433720 RepID=A0A819HGR3_9BILA|nr:unnamed protein product [Adineta steineri]CAF3895641.1 unnamed protein product [Adineta steineri]